MSTYLVKLQGTKHTVTRQSPTGLPTKLQYQADEIYRVTDTGTANPIKVRGGVPQTLNRDEVLMWVLSATNLPLTDYLFKFK